MKDERQLNGLSPGLYPVLQVRERKGKRLSMDGRQGWGGGKDYLSRSHNTPSEIAAAGRFCSPPLGKGPEDLMR